MAAFAPVTNRIETRKSNHSLLGKILRKPENPLPDIKKQCYNNGVTKGGCYEKESAGVTEALLKSAQLEFLTHGFPRCPAPSCRISCSAAGESTNSIYLRDSEIKKVLFEAIVRPAADGLMDIYMHGVSI
ncbi:MAG: hypothetical protein ACLTEE_08960 [Anaerobutyricum hallii]